VPTSRERRERWRRSPEPRRLLSRKRTWRQRIGWPLAVAGLVLFLVGNIGARTGLTILRFDPHHMIAQFGGALVGAAGVLIATGGTGG
jgi:hypothetical protein